jgi:hypothetical protein
MSVYQKLMEARVRLAEENLKKSGHNKFAGYYYYELGDFLPAAMKIFRDLKLYGGVSYGRDVATLTIVDTEKPESTDHVYFYCPMSTADLKGCHPVQNLGAVQTYIRRYLWTAALELVEHDAIDASEPSGAKPKPEPKPEVKPEPKPEPKKQLGPIATADELDNKKPVVEKTWTISLNPDSAPEFAEPFLEALRIALTQATKTDHVADIFRVNRKLFDTLKDLNKEKHSEAMLMLTSTKNNLTKELKIG